MTSATVKVGQRPAASKGRETVDGAQSRTHPDAPLQRKRPGRAASLSVIRPGPTINCFGLSPRSSRRAMLRVTGPSVGQLVTIEPRAVQARDHPQQGYPPPPPPPHPTPPPPTPP